MRKLTDIIASSNIEDTSYRDQLLAVATAMEQAEAPKQTTYPHYFTVNGKRFVTDGTRNGCRRVYDNPPTDPDVIDAEFTVIKGE